MPHETPTSIYIIAERDSQDLATPVLEAGRQGAEELIPVFTTSVAASAYLQQAEWLQTEVVAELSPPDFLKWLLTVQERGIPLIAVDPDRVFQEDGMPQSVIDVKTFLDSLGPIVVSRLTSMDMATLQK
ncbi:MAG: hypothetical protein KDA81_18000 [Planctomycetaceae bacterium]|nr:hypothetical protein [Planctomycetaceae bacterium]